MQVLENPLLASVLWNIGARKVSFFQASRANLEMTL